MEEHYCQRVPHLEYMVSSGAMFDTDVCGKPARFKSSHGLWYCAECWDWRMQWIDRRLRNRKAQKS